MAYNKLDVTNLSIDKDEWGSLDGLQSNMASDNHLLKSDLQVNNQLPKFNLNEPAPTALANSIFQNNFYDETDQSFVVLNQSLQNSVNETSLTNCEEMKNITEISDHSFLISMMSPVEIEEKFKNVLDENVKLRESLKQNSNCIKKQFNVMTAWQKDIITVFDNQKQKYIETKKIINDLKNENDSLRLSNKQAQSQETQIVNNLFDVAQENSETSPIILYSDRVSQTINEAQDILNKSNNEQMFETKPECLLKEISKVNDNSSQNSQKLFEEFSNMYVNGADLFTQQLDKFNKEVECLNKICDSSYNAKLHKLVSECFEKDITIKELKETIESMEHTIKGFEENAISPVDIQLQTSDKNSKENDIFKENIKFYSTELKELSSCFLSQYSHYFKIHEFLKGSIEIIKNFENAKVLSDNQLSEDKIKIYKDKLCEYRKMLVSEQFKSVKDKQAAIKIHQKFHKLLLDYNSVIYEMEVLKHQNYKLTIQNQIEKEMLDIDKRRLLEETLELELEKKNILEEKKKIESEYNSLEVEKIDLAESKTSLLAEKTSLDCQIQLHEIEKKKKQKEKALFIKKIQDMDNEIYNLQEELGKYRQQNQIADKKMVDEDAVSAYKLQLEMNETDIQQMLCNEKSLKDQVESLTMENLMLRESYPNTESVIQE